jgi:hypothetical protein
LVSLSKTIKISEVEEGIIEKEEYNKVFNRLQYELILILNIYILIA